MLTNQVHAIMEFNLLKSAESAKSLSTEDRLGYLSQEAEYGGLTHEEAVFILQNGGYFAGDTDSWDLDADACFHFPKHENYMDENPEAELFCVPIEIRTLSEAKYWEAALEAATDDPEEGELFLVIVSGKRSCGLRIPYTIYEVVGIMEDVDTAM